MIEPTLDETVLAAWIGRSETMSDMIDAAQARRMLATLDWTGDIDDGDALPPLWHWIYFLSAARMSDLGRDGHTRLGGFLPPVALPRRMWAGGRFEFHRPIVIGETITKTSTIDSIAMKHGRSGSLCFVTVRHDLSASDGSARLSEWHDIVYREDSEPDAPRPTVPAAPKTPAWSQTITPSSTLLFRYSALTFNGHRIHYDREYARSVEGYPDLVFHGPLTATLLADLAVRKARGTLRSFAYRGVTPLFDSAPFTIAGRPSAEAPGTLDLWAATPGGALAMSASATFAA